MREPWEWKEDDLIWLITSGTKEDLQLDYKACDALGMDDRKKDEISKDVSAMANSAGGTIVYGMLENGHVPTAIDIGFDANLISKEWLEQVINSRIQRKLSGVRVNQIELTDPRAGRVVYVVYVPQSVYAPHQASNKKFYRRYNFQSVPMEEYEIRDVSQRNIVPDLVIDLQFLGLTLNGEAQLLPRVTNNSVTPAEYAVLRILIDARLSVVSTARGFRKMGMATFDVDGISHDCIDMVLNYAIPGQLPIFQGISFTMGDTPFVLGMDEPGRYLIAWHAYSPRMAEKRGHFWLLREGGSTGINAP